MSDITLDAKVPDGDIETLWDEHKFDMKLVNPANKRKYEIIVVGTGLAGASAAATLAQLGYNVSAFTFHDSPRRAHSIAAQGGINAAKNYHGDGDSVHRLFYDTVKGGALVDDVVADLGEPVDVGLAGAEVAALDGVVEQPEDAVAVVVVVLGGVDAALRRDTVRPSRRILEAKTFNVVPELAQSRCGGSARETASDHDNIKF